MNKISGIYLIKNKVNNKVYIGSSINIYFRWKIHVWSLNKNLKRANDRLKNAWNKYGEQSFEFSILEVCDKNEFVERETYYINEYNSLNPNYGYNIELPIQNIMSESTKLKISKAKSGKNHHQYGKPRTDEEKLKISNSMKGNKPTNKLLTDSLIKSIKRDKNKGMKIKQMTDKYKISKNSIYRALQYM